MEAFLQWNTLAWAGIAHVTYLLEREPNHPLTLPLVSAFLATEISASPSVKNTQENRETPTAKQMREAKCALTGQLSKLAAAHRMG